MTTRQTDATPAPQAPDIQASMARQALRAAELLALERAAVRAVTAPLRKQLVSVQRAATRAWIAAFGSLDAPGDPIRAAAVAAQVRGDLAQISISASAPLAEHVQRALVLGVDQAARQTGTRLTADGIGATVDAPTARIVAGFDQTVTAAIGDAENAVGQIGGRSFSEVNTALAKAHRVVPKATGATVTAINGGANAGQVAVADFLGADLLVFAEADCCTTCAGLAGRVAVAGRPFDAAFASTFTDKPRLWPPGPLEQPPWHPNCRCRAETFFGAEAGPSLPDALQREARRAILKGWSLPGESGPERIRAARKALSRNLVAPASVKNYARRAVAAGSFPTRDVPHYRPRPVAAKTTPQTKGRTQRGKA